MINFNEIKEPEEANLLIAFADLTNFVRVTEKKSTTETFQYISKFSEITGDIIEPAGGIVLKFIGDEALIIFPETRVNEGVIALYRLKQKVDLFNKENTIESQLKVKCHFGSAAIGLLGTKNDKRLDVIGNEVNKTALLKSNGFSMTAETFRKLKPETRKLFKKHTPPLTYIPVEEKHKD